MFAVDHQVVMLRHIMKDPGFDVDKDFAPVARATTYSLCAAVNPASPARDLPGWAGAIRQDVTQGNFGMPAPGSNAHFMGFVIGRQFDVKVNPVSYRGAAPALGDLLGGQLPAAIMPCDMFTEHHRAGRVRVIGVAAERRLAPFPDVGTMAEAGVKVPTDYFTGVWAPAGTPRPMLDALREAPRKALTAPAAVEKMNATGMAAAYASAEELDRITRDSAAFWGEQMRQAGFQPN
jgi:tripartite-type tricarboxylate transporter receptor subunit TctC